jgi:hypothetical protein
VLIRSSVRAAVVPDRVEPAKPGQIFGLIRSLFITSRERLTFDHIEHQQLTFDSYDSSGSRAFLRHQPQFIIFAVKQRSFGLTRLSQHPGLQSLRVQQFLALFKLIELPEYSISTQFGLSNFVQIPSGGSNVVFQFRFLLHDSIVEEQLAATYGLEISSRFSLHPRRWLLLHERNEGRAARRSRQWRSIGIIVSSIAVPRSIPVVVEGATAERADGHLNADDCPIEMEVSVRIYITEYVPWSACVTRLQVSGGSALSEEEISPVVRSLPVAGLRTLPTGTAAEN